MRRIPIRSVLLLLVCGTAAAPLAAADCVADEAFRLRGTIFASPPGQLVQVGEEVRASHRSPAVTEADLMAAGAAAATDRSAARRGRPRQVASSVTIERDPVRVWQEEIHAPGASYVAPYFSYFNLPGRSYLVVRAPDNSRAWTFRGTGKGELASAAASGAFTSPARPPSSSCGPTVRSPKARSRWIATLRATLRRQIKRTTRICLAAAPTMPNGRSATRRPSR